MLNWLIRIFEKHPKVASEISFTDDEIVVSCSKTGDVEGEIFWRAVKTITFRTTDQGPWLPDFFIHFSSDFDPDDLVVHDEMEGFVELTDRISTLPSYDANEALEALRSTGNAKFVVWERASAPT